VISLLITLVVIGVCLWLVQTYVPMAPQVKTVITVVVVIGCCLWLLDVFGVYHFPGRLR
jgi:hypothetical protein